VHWVADAVGGIQISFLERGGGKVHKQGVSNTHSHSPLREAKGNEWVGISGGLCCVIMRIIESRYDQESVSGWRDGTGVDKSNGTVCSAGFVACTSNLAPSHTFTLWLNPLQATGSIIWQPRGKCRAKLQALSARLFASFVRSGAKLKVTVNLGKGVNRVELFDADVVHLRNAIKAAFPDEVGQRSASHLDVQTTDANWQTPLSPKGKPADELGEDGNYGWRSPRLTPPAYPLSVPLFTLVGLESTCFLLDTKSGAPLPPDVPLELHQTVIVFEEQRDQRDNNYAPPAYVVTPQTKDLIDLFFENYKLRSPERFRELCVRKELKRPAFVVDQLEKDEFATYSNMAGQKILESKCQTCLSISLAAKLQMRKINGGVADPQ